ncbi:MAG: putative metallophosphoesterase [Gemmataceae bacterium]|nr:putative metallophosphoesterase [Gemmataceae bacterium]
MTGRRFPQLTRRRFFALAGGTVACGVGAGAYAHWVEPHWAAIVRRDLPLPGLSGALAGKVLVHISDLHVGSTDPDHLTACLRTVSALRPDIVAITGDFMTCDGREQADRVPEVLSHLAPPPLGCFAVPGNHDYGSRWHRPDVADLLSARLAGCGVELLRNGVKEVAGLQVAGVDDLWAGRSRPASALAGLDPARPAVVLCHNPDAVDQAGWGGFRGWVLAGHTHGGQCKPPLFRPPILNLRNPRYAAGAYDLGDGRWLYVNRGLGYVQKVRFNARPEITLFRLVPA